MKYSWRMLFNDFKEHYPNKWRRGTTYEPYDHMTIIISIPEDGKYKYEFFGSKLTLIEQYHTKSQNKYLKKFEREEAIHNIFNEMKQRKITQSRLSRESGISRESINRYKSGVKTPTWNTINLLHDVINKIDI